MTDTAPGTETDADHLTFILDLLAILAAAEKTLQDTPMLWHVKNGRASFHMACSDTFAWGCADAEDIAATDIPLLRQTLTDLKALGDYGEIWLGELYCCRKRQMRPMNRWIKDMREKEEMPDGVLALIEECGPPRESVFGAP